MEHNIIKLNFRSPLHLSKGVPSDYSSSDTVLHSDTIASAIVSVYASVGKSNEEINTFKDSFILSSAYPYFEEKYFFPKPMLTLPLVIEDLNDDRRSAKVMKNIQFVEKSIFEKIIRGKKEIRILTKQLVNGGCFLTNTIGEYPAFSKIEVVQRVKIDSNTGESTPYFLDRMYFNESSGLFFLFRMNDETYKQDFLLALTVLETNGLGTDKSVGNGQFSFEETKIQIEEPSKTNGDLMLSLYCPIQEEIKEVKDDKIANYLLIKRGGYIAGSSDEVKIHYRKKSVYMITEGSVFQQKKGRVGKQVELTPNGFTHHSVWRDGRCYKLSILVEPSKSKDYE